MKKKGERIMDEVVGVTKIAVSSGKGGTGKTFIATNLAKVLSEKWEQNREIS
jgi:MinD-like ATPase involved in chromosome partitioning or flagellar assembly